jgi:hypothetical protein
MKIVDVSGEGVARTYEVEFLERTIEDLGVYGDSRHDEKPFAAAARVSEISGDFYKVAVRPMVRAVASPALAKALVDSNPLRMRRAFFSDRNPLVSAITPIADAVRSSPHHIDPDNTFLRAEQAFSNSVIAFWDTYRDIRDNMYEFWFNAIYGSPLLQALVPPEYCRISETPSTDLRAASDVHLALEGISVGGFAEAVIRMLILLARSRTSVRRDRLERSNHVLTQTEPFASLGLEKRNKIIHRQSLVVDFEPDEALATLPALLPDEARRREALTICETVVGAPADREERTVALFERFEQVLGLGPQSAPPAPPPAKAKRTKSTAVAG